MNRDWGNVGSMVVKVWWMWRTWGVGLAVSGDASLWAWALSVRVAKKIRARAKASAFKCGFIGFLLEMSGVIELDKATNAGGARELT
jgi:hypothetical protein